MAAQAKAALAKEDWWARMVAGVCFGMDIEDSYALLMPRKSVERAGFIYPSRGAAAPPRQCYSGTSHVGAGGATIEPGSIGGREREISVVFLIVART